MEVTNTRAPASVAPRIARFIVVSSLHQFWRPHISALPRGLIVTTARTEIPYFISGDAVPTGMGGRGVSSFGAGGSGRSRSGIRLRAEDTPLAWSAVWDRFRAPIPSGASAFCQRA